MRPTSLVPSPAIKQQKERRPPSSSKSRVAADVPPRTTDARSASQQSPKVNTLLQQQQTGKAEQGAALIDAVLTAVRTGDEDPVIKLLGVGVDVDTKDSEGRTPLIIAARDNRPITVKMMLAHKANVHAKTRLGATALFAAATHGHAGVVKILLAAGADRSAGVNGMRPIDVARRERKPEVAALLLEDGHSNWGTGLPRSQPDGTTSKLHRAVVRARGGVENEEQADDFALKQFRHRERLQKLKDEK